MNTTVLRSLSATRISPKSDVLTFEEIERLTRLFVRAGVEKVRLGRACAVRLHVDLVNLFKRDGHRCGASLHRHMRDLVRNE